MRVGGPGLAPSVLSRQPGIKECTCKLRQGRDTVGASQVLLAAFSLPLGQGHGHRAISKPLEKEAESGEHRSRVLPFELQLGTHIEIVPERGAKREANLGLEEWGSEVHGLLDKLPVSDT